MLLSELLKYIIHVHEYLSQCLLRIHDLALNLYLYCCIVTSVYL